MRGSVRDEGVKEDARSPRDKRWTPSESDAVDVVGGCGCGDERQCMGKHEARNHSKVDVAWKCLLEVCRAGGVQKRQEKVTRNKKQEVRAEASERARHSRGCADNVSRASRSRVGAASNHPTTCSVGSNSSSSGYNSSSSTRDPSNESTTGQPETQEHIASIGAAKRLPNLKFGWRVSRTAKEHRGGSHRKGVRKGNRPH
ncbi:hypothetical protein EDD15DRAFT_2194599 [Pisolithus albus]|nr:hypothetical protein EDD15DRAFT_2194599 [Pisolithus albus]